jgi:recombination associated protein RdgC
MFKNAIIYRLTQKLGDPGENLEQRKIREPGALEVSTTGWGKVGHGPEIFHQVENCTILTHERREKILPSSVVNEEVQERVEKVEIEEGRRLRRSEVAGIKEQVLTELLPRALVRTVKTSVLIDDARGLLIVDTASPKRADDATALPEGEIPSMGGADRLLQGIAEGFRVGCWRRYCTE